MVDFSDRKAIKGWLDAIEPAERRQEVAVVIAARAALRVTPLLKGATTKERAGELIDLAFPSFRATAVAWAAAKYPAHGAALRAAATAAIATDDTRGFASARAAAAFVAAYSAARAAADAVDAAAFAAAFADADAGARATAADAALIGAGRSPADLASMPLWLNGRRTWASKAWETLKSALLADNDDWQVWTGWYEARLAGDAANPTIEDLEIARATIADEIWKQGPAVVNAEIKRLIAEHSTAGSPEAESNDASIQDEQSFEPILATRAATRVLPVLATDTDRTGDRDKSKFALSVFRALAVAWARTQFSDWVDPKFSVAAARNVSAYAAPSVLAARLVGNAAAEAAFSAGSKSPRVARSRASVALEKVKQVVAATSRDLALAVIVEQASASDKADIVPGVRPEQLSQIELWPGRDPPALIGRQWESLKEDLRAAPEAWDVWIDWYEARLDGRVRSQEVELAYVNYIHNVSPTATAWEANSEIKRLIDLYEPKSASPPPIESIPEQERTGTRFGTDDQGRIDVLRTPPTTDDLQRFHYDEMRYKAQALSGLGQMLGDIAHAVSRILDALPEHIEDASIDKLWSRANTLRRRHNAHLRSAENYLGPDPSRLDVLVAENLGDFIDSFNVYVIGDPRGLELDRIRLGPQDREVARKIADLAAPIARAAAEPDSPATPLAQEALSEQVGAAIDAPDDINGDQAAELARKTAGNFVSELLRRAYAPIEKLGGVLTGETKVALEEYRAGIYRAAGTRTFAGLCGVAYLYWPAISSFVVRNADALRAFAAAAYQNPKLVEIIDWIVRAAGHI